MAKYNVMFLGHGRMAHQCVTALMKLDPEFHVSALVTNPDFYKGFSAEYPKAQATFIDDNNRNIEQILDAIKRHEISFLFSSHYKWVLPGEVLDAVNRRAFNLHPAKLPKYQGFYSIAHVLANRENRHAVTIHAMSEQVDLGDILEQQEFDIDPGDTALSLYQKTIPVARQVFDKFIERVRLDDLTSGAAQDPEVGWFYSKEAFEVLRKVTWNDTPSHIDGIIRGCFFPPYEPAYVEYADRKYFLVPKNSPAWEKVHPFNKSIWEMHDLQPK